MTRRFKPVTPRRFRPVTHEVIAAVTHEVIAAETRRFEILGGQIVRLPDETAPCQRAADYNPRAYHDFYVPDDFDLFSQIA